MANPHDLGNKHFKGKQPILRYVVWRPSLGRLEPIASRLEAIASRLEAVATRLEAITIWLEAIASESREKDRLRKNQAGRAEQSRGEERRGGQKIRTCPCHLR